MLSISFKPRQSRHTPKDKPHVIYCTVSVNGIPATPFSTKIRLYVGVWNNLTERAKSDPLAKSILIQVHEIEADIRQTFNDLRRSNQAVTASEIVRLYTNKVPGFLSLFRDMLDERRAINLLRDSSVRIWNARYKNAELFIRSHLGKQDIPVDFIQASWEHDLRAFFNPRASPAYVSRLIASWKTTLSYALRKGYINSNPFEFVNISIPAPKAIKFLTQAQLSSIIRLNLSDRDKLTRDWFIVQCFTGMSYVDTSNFNPDRHIHRDKDGILWIMIYRQKIDRWQTIPCKIPLLKPARDILIEYGYRLPFISLRAMNRRLKKIGLTVGYDGLSTKVARSTAGTYLLNEGVRMEVVAEVLGHVNLRTTQKSYAFLQVDTVKSQTHHLIDKGL